MARSCIYISVLVAFSIALVEPFSDSRLELLEVPNKGDTQISIVFHNKNGLCRWTVYNKALQVAKRRSQIKGTNWQNIPLPNGLVAESTPSAISVSNVTGLLFIQASNGQVYATSFTKEENPKFGGWLMVGGTKLAFNDGSKLSGRDNVKAVFFAGKPYVLARSHTNSSRCYWTALVNDKWLRWSLVGGGSVSLLTDVSVVYNSFSKYLEAFAVMKDGYMYRTWQTGFSDWHSWDKTGYYAPKSVHSPVAHEMDTNMFNGRINVFVHGTDGKVHHIWQTTCDKVPNPWGWCTWSSWNTIGEIIPPAMNVANTLSIANNMHLGIEIFTVDKKGKLNYMWQSERHGKWHSWKTVTETQSTALATVATVTNDKTGWWVAYGLDASDNIFFIQEMRSISLAPSKIVSGNVVDIKWSVPVDQATHMDWIGVYKKGVDSHEYIDYYYVGGTQNPYKDPVPNGELKFRSYLPAGVYEYRYLVNKRFVPAVQASLEVTKGPSDVKWVQIFRGLFTGLQLKNVSVETCVKDAEKTVDYFEQAFTAFEDREIYKGLHLVGYGLSGATVAMKDCHIDSAIVSGIEKFVKDLISCIKGSCVHFAIDALKEVVILFENMYEIYGDIRGASNSFKIKAYEQGGWNIGRAVFSCIHLR